MNRIESYGARTQGSSSPKGSVNNPYTQAEYLELKENGEWFGGYVVGLGYILYELVIIGSFSDWRSSWMDNLQEDPFCEDDECDDDVSCGDDFESCDMYGGGGHFGETSDSDPICSNEQNGLTEGQNVSIGHCLYDCMAYLSTKLQGLPFTSSDWASIYRYGYNDEGQNNSWLGTKDENDEIYGPNFVIEYHGKNYFSFYVTNFINVFFETTSNYWKKYDDVQELFDKNDESEQYVLGVVKDKTTGASFHAVILTQYDSETDKYSYFDPSGEYETSDNLIKSESVKAGIKIISSKQK